MDPAQAVSARNLPGGTAPEAVEAVTGEMHARLATDRATRDGRVAHLRDAGRRRAERVAQLIG